jgi:N-acetylglucosamine-6-phosphate deacetylase
VESLGAHCEGPFIHPEKKGAHSEEYIQLPGNGIRSIEVLYGAENLKPRSTTLPPVIKKITIAPELPGSIEAIKSLTKEHGIVCSIGHTTATYEQGLEAVKAGATKITHLFNAMDPFLHRAPGLVGLISAPVADLMARPYFGLISDDIHLSPNSVRAAWLIHEEGCILTTDATAVTGLPDGTYDSRLVVHVVKKGKRLVIEGTDTVAGGYVPGALIILQAIKVLMILMDSAATLPMR